ncbi:MAG: Sensor histidine kinase TmoS [Pseudomonadota bacterium]
MSTELLGFVLAFLYLGLLLEFVPRSRDRLLKHISVYWPAAIACLTVNFVLAGLVPNAPGYAVTLMNVFGWCASLMMCAALHSFRAPLSRRLKLGLVIAVIAAATAFDLIRQQGNSYYVIRATYSTCIFAAASLWMIVETWYLQRIHQSSQLRITLVIASLIFLLLTSRAVLLTMSGIGSLEHVHQENLLLTLSRLLPTLATFLLVFSINNFFFERVLQLEDAANRTLQSTMASLNQAEGENQLIRELNQSLQQSIDEKQQLLQALTVANKTRNLNIFSAALAHEVSQPLASIQLNAQILMRDDLDKLPVEQRQQRLLNIVEGSRRASSIVQRLKRFINNREKSPASLSLHAVVDEMLGLVQSRLESGNIRIALSVGDDVRVFADESQLQMVMLNLLNNAIDAVMDVEGERCIWVSFADAGPFSELVVEDNGPGIAPAQLESVFDVFQTSKADGIGLGLWLCREVLALHGGFIQAGQRPGGGARFTIRLPAPAVAPSA